MEREGFVWEFLGGGILMLVMVMIWWRDFGGFDVWVL